VLVNVSRGLSSPITLGPDHNDVLAARDTGFIQIHVETCQEVLDSVLMAFRIAEDSRVCMPVLVNLDGFFLSFTREPVEIPDAKLVQKFLPTFRPHHPVFKGSQSMAQGVAVLDGAAYSYFRYQMHRAVENALEVHEEVAEEFYRLFGRRYGALEEYRMEDAEIVLVMAGSFSTKGKAAVNRWREQGRKVGLVRLRLIRPQPAAEIVRSLSGRKAVGVLDQNISPGLGGILYQEVAGAVASAPERPPVMRSFIGGLGGKDISQAEFDRVLEVLDEAKPGEGPVPCELLFTDAEYQQVKTALRVAGKPVEGKAS